MTENPQPPTPDDAPTGETPTENAPSQWDTYNVVTDTVTGVNVRWSDNRLQAIWVMVSVVLAAAVGAILAALNAQWDLPWFGGAMVGAFAGLVIGILSSGIFLMVYRATRHLHGKHD